jgi:hypothetical protein
VSVEKIALVLNYSKSRGTDKVVLIGIANHEGDGGAWPSVATLARYANVDERTVQRSIANLVDLGELEVERQAGGNTDMRPDRRPNRYRVLVTRPTSGVTPTSSRAGNGVTSMTPRGDASVADGVTPTSPEPPIEPSIEPRLPATVVAAPNAGTIITAWIEGLRVRPPDRVVGQTAREVRLLLEQGFDPSMVLEALRSISGKGLHPSTLASELNTILNPPTTMRGGANTADQRLNGLKNLLVGSDRGPA